MYNDLTSAEGKYLLYLIDNISDLENNFNEILKDRDFKLKLVLYDEYESLKSDFNNNLNEIKRSVDRLNLKSLDTKELEKIASDINILINYFEKITDSKYVGDSC